LKHPDRTHGYKSALGRGATGGTPFVSKKQAIKARPGLTTMETGQPRGKYEEVCAGGLSKKKDKEANEAGETVGLYVPARLPKCSDEPGHVVFALDVPAVYRKIGDQITMVRGPAKRILINRTRHDEGAQLSVETYHPGTDAKPIYSERKTQNADGSGGTVPEMYVPAPCRETISITGINVGDVVWSKVALTTTSTAKNKIGLVVSENDMQSTTKVTLVTTRYVSDFEFDWTVVSVGKPETDLSCGIADSLKETCYDPQSAARTLCNVIHYFKDN